MTESSGEVPAGQGEIRAEVGSLGTGRWTVVAGVVDAGLASLATLVVGVFASRVLDPAGLGAYGLVFAAFTTAAVIPAQLVFIPLEVAALSLPSLSRAGLLGSNLVLGSGPALLAALMVPFCAVIMPQAVPLGGLGPLLVTAGASTLISPAQDHVRRMLHLAGSSWLAAGVSSIQLLVVVCAVAVFTLTGVAAWWIPFGSLALANLVSLVFGMAVAGGLARPGRLALSFAAAARSGRWLVLIGLLPTGGAFLAATVVSRVAGLEPLGYAEAARVLSQPVWVLAMGLSASLGPRSMEAARGRRLQDARETSRLLIGLLSLTGLIYLAVVSVHWPGNPFPRLLPLAYAVPQLLALTVAVNILNSLVFPYRSELLAGGREKALLRVETVGNLLRIALGVSADRVGAFAIPLGAGTMAAARWWGYRRALRAYYSMDAGRLGR